MRARLHIALFAAAGLLLALLALRLWPHEPLLARFPASTAVYSSDGELLRLTLAADGRYRLPVPLEEISPRLIEAVLWHEDRWFSVHPGINPLALLRGATRTYLRGDRRVGGSTLTMQLARRLWNIDSRRVPGKLVQLLRALQLEAQYSKREILEAYLNLAPYGGNVEGVGAASLVYFRRRAADLGFAEAFTLAVVPQSPAARLPRPGNAALLAASRGLFASWRAAHGASVAEQAAMELPLRLLRPADLPFSAPHQVQALLDANTDGSAEIVATLELRRQWLLERIVRGYVARQRRIGVTNAAALLVDARELRVLASVGSADFLDAAIGGQNDGTRMRRSPGSALKPFIYALAMDQGLLHPATVLKDTPQAFGAQAPENFDGEFVGPLTVQQALVRSRNVPAVATGLQLSSPGFHAFLREAGVGRLQAESHYGLALYLGGPEVTMRELAALYAMLANGGVLQPLRDRLDASTPTPTPTPTPTAHAPAPAPGPRLLSEGASWMTLDMLAQQPRPQQGYTSGAVRSAGPVYWKTGTSTGFRDAWSAAVFDDYVLVVWIGNFDGRPNPAFVGAQVAAPLLFEIVDGLRATRRHVPGGAPPPERPAFMLRPPASLRRVEVCAASGDLPNEWCPRTVPTWYLPGISPIRVSTLHRAVWVDTRSGLQACQGTPARFLRREVHEFWSSDLLALFARAGLPRRAPPALDPRCTAQLAERGAAGRPPQIESPRSGVRYVLREGPQAVPLQLRAASDADASELFWFADGVFLGRVRAGSAFEWRPPAAGDYLLRVLDDAGRAASRAVHVARLE
ncbi:MAG: penicillin-binding protein 1C [Steroidobacteraceae bacterium]